MNCFESEERIEGDFYYDGGRYRVTAFIISRVSVQGAGVISRDRFEPNFIRYLMVRIRESDGTNETHLESANSANGPKCDAEIGCLWLQSEYFMQVLTMSII